MLQAYRFPSRLRLTTAADFKHVFQHNLRSADSCFTVLARSNELGHPRLGLAISRKAAPLAVKRNRIKRVIRDSFRRSQQRLPPVDIVVMARPAAAGAGGQVLRQSLTKHWNRICKSCRY